MIDARKAAREGKRMYAFYQGFKARRRGAGDNPYTKGSEDYLCWANGWKYAGPEVTDGPA
jgi:hypothetical protein